MLKKSNRFHQISNYAFLVSIFRNYIFNSVTFRSRVCRCNSRTNKENGMVVIKTTEE